MNLRCRIDMTVFAAVVLVVLFIFMTLPTPHGGRPIELAKTRNALPMLGADREDALIVAVQRDGKIFFETTQVAPEELPIRIEAKLKQGAPRIVFLKADARARYRSVAEVVDGVHAAGMQRLVLLTDQRRSPFF